MIRRYYTPTARDTLSQVRKCTYEAEKSAMMEFIEDTKVYSDYDIDSTITDPRIVGNRR